MQVAGYKLRAQRERKGLSLAEVERLTGRLARARRDRRLRVLRSCLCEIETIGRTASIYRLYALAPAYRCDIRSLPAFYRLFEGGVALRNSPNQ